MHRREPCNKNNKIAGRAEGKKEGKKEGTRVDGWLLLPLLLRELVHRGLRGGWAAQSDVELAADQPQERRRRRRRRWLQPQKHAEPEPEEFPEPEERGRRGGARRSFFGGRASARSSKAAQSAEMARLAAVEAAAQAEVERNKTVPEQVRGLVVNEYTEVDTIIRLLRLPNKPVRLARPRFFQRCLEKKEPMGCRQEIPDVAFLDTDKYTDDELRARLDVVAISYARLDPGHPDPNMFHLETIVKMLNCFTQLLQVNSTATASRTGNRRTHSHHFQHTSKLRLLWKLNKLQNATTCFQDCGIIL